MKSFHISDVLSVITGRLVSSRHMAGVYEILNFLTGDDLFTHQLPRAERECEPWLRSQFPSLMRDSLGMPAMLAVMDERLRAAKREECEKVVADWVDEVRTSLKLPEMLVVYELGAEMHTRIDPMEELRAMVGDDKVIALEIE